MTVWYRLEIEAKDPVLYEGKELVEYMEKCILQQMEPFVKQVRTLAVAVRTAGFGDDPPIIAKCPECSAEFTVEE